MVAMSRGLRRACRLLQDTAGRQARWMSAASVPAEAPEASPQLPPFDYEPMPYTGPSKDAVRSLRKQHLNPAILHHFKEPVMVVEGKQQYLFDERGRRYLDAFAGIVTVSVGHCHPKVKAAVDEQNKRLQHTTPIYLNHQIAEYAKELTDRLPGNLKVAYFVNSGTEATELALMMARLYTGSFDIVALRNCYHGATLLGHGTWTYNLPQAFGIKHVLNPNAYRGAFGNDGQAYARDVQDMIETATSGRVAGYISESIQGVGGCTPLADGYLPAVYEIVRRAGGVCIADEVQTGFGRTGSHFWGFENHGVQPDIVTMAKGIGNGLPLGAVVTTPEIAQTLAARLHFNTYGGNPVCCAGGRAVLQAIDEDGTQQNSAKVGEYLLDGFRRLQQKHDIIGDVRGRGLMTGMELVRDRTTKEPAKEETVQAFEKMKDLGLLSGKGGLYGNVFRVKPPMCFTREDADFTLQCFDQALSEL